MLYKNNNNLAVSILFALHCAEYEYNMYTCDSAKGSFIIATNPTNICRHQQMSANWEIAQETRERDGNKTVWVWHTHTFEPIPHTHFGQPMENVLLSLMEFSRQSLTVYINENYVGSSYFIYCDSEVQS